MTVLPKEK